MPMLIVLRVASEEKLATVFGTVIGTAEMVTVVADTDQDHVMIPRVKTTAARPARDVPASQRKHYVGGVKNKGISTEALALQVITANTPKQTSLTEIQKAFESHDPPFAPSGAAASCSVLVSQGKVVRIAQAIYALPDLANPAKPRPNGAPVVA